MRGIVDYHGSRLMALRRLVRPTAVEVARLLADTFDQLGAPARLLTDRAPVFRAPAVQAVLAAYRVRHVLTRPSHPWTNGRIERIFR